MLPRDAEKIWDHFTVNAFRMEARPQYLVEPEIALFAEWQRNPAVTAVHPFLEWLEQLQSARQRGAVIQRVRVFTLPKTAYVEFELEFYKLNVGEDIRLLEVDTLPEQNDFWLFDNEVAIIQHHDDEGHFLGTDVVDDKSTVDELVAVKHYLLARATPYVA